MDYCNKYDRTNPESIESYSKKLIGKTFQDIIDMAKNNANIICENTNYGDKKYKGGLGVLLEELYFGYQANSDRNADFNEAGVELKVTPFQKLMNGKLSAGERLVLTMISYEEPVVDNFYQSHVWEKCKLILLIYYERDKKLHSNLLYKMHFVNLFTPPKSDLPIILNDYKIITNKIKNGLAHELSESDTLYLGACTKGATAAKSTVPQYYFPHTKARKRAFCFKRSYMDYVLNNYIISGKPTYEAIVKDVSELEDITFEEYIISKINKYIGKSDKSLCDIFNREYNNNKAQWIELSYRMLGIRSNQAEEFVKANIVVKAIRLNENGKMVESMSFPPFKFKGLIKEKWEDSNLFTYFDETRFLFVVYKKINDEYILKGCKLWNMPFHDLDTTVHKGWKKVRDTINNGVVLTKKIAPNQTIIENNLPKKNDNYIVHIRPHAQKSAYKFSNGEIIGNIERDANELPDGQWMTTQSFWINNTYILSQLDKHLIN